MDLRNMPSLEIHLLGQPRVELDGLPLKVDTRKTLALLFVLAVDGPTLRREFLTNLLWPEKNRKKGEALLRHSLYILRKVLPPGLLHADRETATLPASKEVWVDLVAFRDLLSAGETDMLIKAAELYRDHFLAGFSLKDSADFDNWQRDRYVALMDEAGMLFEQLVQRLGAEGEQSTAFTFCRRWLELDRLNEKAHKTMMQLYVDAGQRASALYQYRECERILRNELSETPGEETPRSITSSGR
jgi:DNA-binding SARP family transcriptional activator